MIRQANLKVVAPAAYFAGLAVLVLGPLLHPGFVLALDLVFAPSIKMPAAVSNDYLFFGGMHLLNMFIPADAIEKILLFGVLFLAGMGAYRLTAYAAKNNRWADYAGRGIASTLYVLNPFTYDRFITGQYQVLLGYALLPFFAEAAYIALQQLSFKRAIIAGLWAAVLCAVSVHAAGYIAVLLTTGGVVACWQNPKGRLRVLGAIVVCVVTFAAASSYWLAPALAGRGALAQAAAHISASNTAAFATVGNGLVGKLWNIVRLQGFWAETLSMYRLPETATPTWLLLILIMWGLAVYGLAQLWKHGQRTLAVWATLSLFAAALLATGAGLAYVIRTLPFAAGFREPQKLVTVIALCLAILVARGVAELLSYVQTFAGKAYAYTMCAACVLLPVAITPTMIWACNQQLWVSQYPIEWSTVNRILSTDTAQPKTLFLPWHMYMYFNFARRIIVTPAPEFFDVPIISSSDPEFRGAVANITPSAQEQAISSLLSATPINTKLTSQLAALHIKYVILAKTSDYMQYDYLHRLHGLRLLFNGSTVELYVVTLGGKHA